MQHFTIVHTTHLFPTLDALLIDLLKNLHPNDWNKPTPAPKWTVKDVATHLLDGNLRAISMIRDGYFGHAPEQIDSYSGLVNFLNRLNADFILAFKRVSPAMLVELLEKTGHTFSKLMAGLPTNEPAVFSVAWAGQSESPNWFHVAREYTEKWHHQQQIRAAVGLEGPLYAKDLYHPYLQTSMYALPFQYRYVKAAEGDLVKIVVMGEGGGEWFLLFANDEWKLVAFAAGEPACTVCIEEKLAWRIFMNAAKETEVKQQVTITGKVELGLPILGVRAVMV
jgi:uncharacterized protein (TIGR03083 family)